MSRLLLKIKNKQNLRAKGRGRLWRVTMTSLHFQTERYRSQRNDFRSNSDSIAIILYDWSLSSLICQGRTIIHVQLLSTIYASTLTKQERRESFTASWAIAQSLLRSGRASGVVLPIQNVSGSQKSLLLVISIEWIRVCIRTPCVAAGRLDIRITPCSSILIVQIVVVIYKICSIVYQIRASLRFKFRRNNLRHIMKTIKWRLNSTELIFILVLLASGQCGPGSSLMINISIVVSNQQ